MNPKDWKVTLLLADYAECINGKLYIMGGGWSVTGPDPSVIGIAAKIEVPWDETNRRHRAVLRLVDSDGQVVQVQTPVGDAPFEIPAEFEVGRPPGLKPGTPIDMPFAFNLGPLPLPPDRRFVLTLAIDDASADDWQVTFTTRPAQPAAPQQPA